MSFSLIIKEEAVAEIDEAFSYYEKQQAGLGQRFIIDLEDHLSDVHQTPHHYSFLFTQQRFRSHSLEKFPYSIIYEITNNEVIVYSVCNTYKNTEDLFKRLPK